jgi:hypothetical protein
MQGKRLFNLIARWRELSWIDRKHISWISWHSCHKRLLAVLGTSLGLFSIVIFGFLENHINHLVMIYSVIILGGFYVYGLHLIIRTLQYEFTGWVELDRDGIIIGYKGGQEYSWNRKMIGMSIDKWSGNYVEERRAICQRVLETGKPDCIELASRYGFTIKVVMKPVKNNQGDITSLKGYTYKKKPLLEFA